MTTPPLPTAPPFEGADPWPPDLPGQEKRMAANRAAANRMDRHRRRLCGVTGVVVCSGAVNAAGVLFWGIDTTRLAVWGIDAAAATTVAVFALVGLYREIARTRQLNNELWDLVLDRSRALDRCEKIVGLTQAALRAASAWKN